MAPPPAPPGSNGSTSTDDEHSSSDGSDSDDGGVLTAPLSLPPSVFGTMSSTSSGHAEPMEPQRPPMSPLPHSIFGTMGSARGEVDSSVALGTPPSSPHSPQQLHLELLRQQLPSRSCSSDTLKMISDAVAMPPQGPKGVMSPQHSLVDDGGAGIGSDADATLPRALPPPGALANEVPIGSFIGVLEDSDEDVDSMEEEECFERVVIAQQSKGRRSSGAIQSFQSDEITHIDLAYHNSPKTTPSGTPTLTRKSVQEARSSLGSALFDPMSGVRGGGGDAGPVGPSSLGSNYGDTDNTVFEPVPIASGNLSKGGSDMAFDAGIAPRSGGGGDMVFASVEPAEPAEKQGSAYDDIVMSSDDDIDFGAVIPETDTVDAPADPPADADGRRTAAAVPEGTHPEQTAAAGKVKGGPFVAGTQRSQDSLDSLDLPVLQQPLGNGTALPAAALPDRPPKSATQSESALTAYLASMVARLDEKVSEGNDGHNLKAKRRISGETMVMRESMAKNIRTKVNSVLAALREVFPECVDEGGRFGKVGEVFAATGKTIEAVFDRTMDLSEVVFQSQNAVTYARLLVRNYVRLVRLVLKSRNYANIDLEHSGLPLIMAILEMGTGLAGMLVRIEDTGSMNDDANDPLVWMKLHGCKGATDIVLPDPAEPPPLLVLAASEPTMIVGGKQRSLRCSQFLGVAGRVAPPAGRSESLVTNGDIEPDDGHALALAAAGVVLEFPEDPGRPDLAVRLRVLDSSTLSPTALSPVIEISATVVSDALESGAVLRQPLMLYIPHDAMKVPVNGAAAAGGNFGMFWSSGPGAGWRPHNQVVPISYRPQSPAPFVSAALPRFGWYVIEGESAKPAATEDWSGGRPLLGHSATLPARHSASAPMQSGSPLAARAAPLVPGSPSSPRRAIRRGSRKPSGKSSGSRGSDRKPSGKSLGSQGSGSSRSRSNSSTSEQLSAPRVVSRPKYHLGGSCIVQGKLLGSSNRAVVVTVAEIRDSDSTIQLRYGGGDEEHFEVTKRVTWAKFQAALGSGKGARSTEAAAPASPDDSGGGSGPRDSLFGDRAQSAASEITVRPEVRLSISEA